MGESPKDGSPQSADQETMKQTKSNRSRKSKIPANYRPMISNVGKKQIRPEKSRLMAPKLGHGGSGQLDDGKPRLSEDDIQRE